MKKYFTLLLFTSCYQLLASNDLKEPLNPFDDRVTSAIIAKQKATQQKKKKETTVSISESHSINSTPHQKPKISASKKKCCPEWCGDFCLPLSVLLCVCIMGGGAAYCKVTSSCLGFGSNEAANSTISTNSTLTFSQNIQPTAMSVNSSFHDVRLKALLNTRNTAHAQRKNKRKFNFLKQPKR